jgi:TonB family protein
MLSDTFYRITGPLFDRIPDISHQPPARQVSIGIAASLLLHAAILVLALLFGMLLPERALISFAKSKPKLQEIELTIIPPEPAVQLQPEAPRLVTIEEITRARPFLDSRGLAKSDRAPDGALLESDVDMIAASELPATGSAPLPSQEGRTDREFPAFATHQVTLGSAAVPFPTDVSLDSAKLVPEQQSDPRISPESSKPEPDTKQPEEKTPKPPTPAGSAPPKDTGKMNKDQIALAVKSSTIPKATPEPLRPPPPVRPVMRTTDSMTLLTTPVPRAKPQPQQSGFQPQLEKTRVEGSITNRGRNAVDAAGTPLARYKKAVNDTIGARWYHYVKDRMDLIAGGSVRISFTIQAEGKVTGIKVESNTANPAFAEVCERAVRDAEIAALPPAVAEPLLDQELDYTLTFTFHNF